MKKKLIVSILLCLLLVVSYCIYHNMTIYSNSIINTDNTVFALYVDGTSTQTLPSKDTGYIFDTTNSSCTNGASITWDNTNWKATVTNLTTSRTKCTLYFKKATYCDLHSGTGACTIWAKGETTELALDGTSDNNLRYIGANPNNYVSFNGELWRIIGVMNNIDNGSGTKETRLKIIRNKSIGKYSWNSSESTVNGGYGVNEWSQADLMTELNSGPYWNRTSGTCYNNDNNSTTTCDFSSIGLTSTSQSMIGNALWNTGSNGTNSSWYDSGAVTQFYTLERSSDNGKICTSGTYCTDTVSRTTTWIGRVGLMYPSDYFYATGGGSTTNRASCLATIDNNWNSTYTDCKTNDWLFNYIDQWTIMPGADSSYAFHVFAVYSTGYVAESNASYAAVVRPVGYLDSKTRILSGTGTSSDPYILSA